MPVKFDTVLVGSHWDRKQLATLWGYKTFHALARGAITPANDNKVILFITHEKQSHSDQYEDILEGDIVKIDGEMKHRSDSRLIEAADQGDQIHLFYRDRSHQLFTYHGQIDLESYERKVNQPSRFIFKLRR